MVQVLPNSTRQIRPRKMKFQFGAQIPRWWFANNPVITHISNGLSLVFPEGERFFIRSVKHYLSQLDDPELQQRARAFFQQESRHGQEHAASFEMLEAQGYELERYLHFYEKQAVPFLEGLFPPSFRLATTVALEHLTATMGESALMEDFMDLAHEEMAALMRWHAAEEIEHKSVAFDVFQAVDGRYTVRTFGMLFGLAALMTFWTIGSRRLLRQEHLPKAEWKKYRAEAEAMRGGHTGKLLRRAFLEYLDPNFHPDKNDNYHLAEQYLSGIGRLAG